MLSLICVIANIETIERPPCHVFYPYHQCKLMKAANSLSTNTPFASTTYGVRTWEIGFV